MKKSIQSYNWTDVQMSSARDYGGTVCYIVTGFNLTETGDRLITIRPDLADYSPAGYFHYIAAG